MSLADSITFGSLIGAVQTVALVVIWLRKPGQDASAAVGKMKTRVDVLEERIKHMPTTDELTELEGTVKAIKATLDGMADSHDVVRTTLTRVENYLLNHKTT